MKKRIFLTEVLMLTLLAPVPKAHAQGYPNFDIAKLAGLITDLVGRFQPVPQFISQVNQIKSVMTQIQAVATAAASGDLKSLAQAAAGALKSGAFSNGRPKSDVSSAAEGDGGAQKASQKIKDSLFALNENEELSADDLQRIYKAREDYVKDIRMEAQSKALFLVMNAAEKSQDRMKKAEDALSNAESVQDGINANTMTVMVGNFERLNQIALSIATLKMDTASHIYGTPISGYRKPDPYTLKLGDIEYTAEDKGGPDVDL